MTTVAIFDRDDTLADTASNSGKIGFRRMDDYNKAMVDDPVRPGAVAWWESVPPGVDRAVVTGRYESSRPYLEEWLDKNGLHPDVTIMRPDGDNRPNAEFKSSATDELLQTYDSVLYAMDDNPKALTMYQDRGIVAVDATKV